MRTGVLDCPSPCGFRPGMQLALREQLMKPGSAPRPTQWGARGPAEGGAAQRGAVAAPVALLAASRPAFDRPPSCRCLWLSPWHKQPVSRPGACLHERWRLQQNQPFLFQETHATWKAAPRPPPGVFVWPHTPAGTPESLTLAPAPMTGPPTAQTTLAAPPPGPLQGSTSGWEPWLEGRKQQAVEPERSRRCGRPGLVG